MRVIIGGWVINNGVSILSNFTVTLPRILKKVKDG